MTDKAIRSAKLTAAGLLDKARARTAVTRAGGQIAPSKYLPNVPRQVHAGGGEVVNLGKEKLVRSITKAASDVKSGAHQERMDQRARKLHESGHLPLPIGTKVTPPQGWDMPSELHIHGYWQDILHPEQHGYKLKSESGDLYEVQHQMHSGQNPYVFGGGFKAYSGPVRNRAGYSDEAMAPRNPILQTRTPEQSDQLNKEYDQLFGTEPDITKADGGRIHAEGGGKMELRSRAAEAIRNQPQLKGSVDQLLAVAAKGKGVKQAELANAGRPSGNIISKEKLAQHFEDAAPDVRVKRYQNIPAVGHTQDERREYNHLSYERVNNRLDEDQISRWHELHDKTNPKGGTKYGKWTLDIGNNYREHLLHLPSAGGEVNHRVLGAYPRDFDTEAEAHEYIGRMNRAAGQPGMEPIRDSLRQYPLTYSPETPPSDKDFQSSHWDVPNVLAHVRMKDLFGGDGLFVQEVQSDWGQGGREQGFYDPQNPHEVVRKDTKEVVSRHPNYSSMWDAYRTHPDADNLTYGDVREEKVPQAPYVGNTQQWTDLALKHVLTEAAKNGKYKRVVFAPGEANADLYGQRRQIAQATLKPMPDEPEMLGELYGWDKDTGEQINHGPINDEKELASALGKQHAQALLAQPLVRNSHRSLITPGMVLGGHGMADYYNNIVHPSALKLLQQHDPSIQPEKPYEMPGQEGTDNYYKGLSLPMTETARQSILKNGFGTFKRGGMVGKEEGGATGSLREKALWPSAQAIKAGTGSREAHAELVNKIKPVSPYAAPVAPASDQQVHDALTKDKQPKAFAPRALEEGTPVAVRLDIPAYEKRNTWVVSVHHPKSDFTAGEVIGYDSVAHIGNPRFGVHPAGALNIASGKPKATIATVHGNWKKTTPEDAFKLSQTIHNDPQWRQVGMDPERHSYFYDRETQEPVMAADEALHIGPLVYAKNPVYGKKTDFAFSKGGGAVDDALALTRRFTKDGAGATMALKPKGK